MGFFFLPPTKLFILSSLYLRLRLYPGPISLLSPDSVDVPNLIYSARHKEMQSGREAAINKWTRRLRGGDVE